MRSYLSYKADGRFCGVIKTTHPEGYDILSKDPKHPRAVNHHSVHSKQPDFAGYVAVDCDCTDYNSCQCAAKATYNHYVNDSGELTKKSPVTLKINGIVVSTSREKPFHITPGSTFILTIEADVPDNTSATLYLKEARLAKEIPTIIFQAGKATCNLTSPAQGLIGILNSGDEKFLSHFVLYVSGWNE